MFYMNCEGIKFNNEAAKVSYCVHLYLKIAMELYLKAKSSYNLSLTLSKQSH